MRYHVYKVTFPNGRIYIGKCSVHIPCLSELTHKAKKNRGIAAALKRAKGKQVIVDSVFRTNNFFAALETQQRLIIEQGSNNPQIGYNAPEFKIRNTYNWQSRWKKKK